VIQEFAHVRSRRRSRVDAAALARGYADLLAPLHSVDDGDLQTGLDLFVAHEGLGAFDAVLAAAVLGSDHLRTLVSADQTFGVVDGLDLADPARAADLDRLGVGGRG
jgi:hypothetical protein